ncbi:hypothetical protein PoB_002170000 [Plakobranchus ocellatus]|uniref:Uncharacterized protein n=1 Tax=Plakobranchus ocellatus TaxID=259542 RepID=A0AAV3ZHT5_9GAST|nr:hypothetical protein PoB_002170000 [Plakobranchus ocellatus]
MQKGIARSSEPIGRHEILRCESSEPAGASPAYIRVIVELKAVQDISQITPEDFWVLHDGIDVGTRILCYMVANVSAQLFQQGSQTAKIAPVLSVISHLWYSTLYAVYGSEESYRNLAAMVILDATVLLPLIITLDLLGNVIAITG